MNKDLIVTISFMTICLVVVGVCAFSIYKKAKSNSTQTQKVETNTSNTYEIKDESLGVTFLMDKSFERIEQKELQAKNPYFIYGFKPKDVSDVSCYVSQTKRSKPGTVPIDYLRDGTFNEIKKASPDAILENWKEINLGAVTGVKLDMKFKEGDKNMKQVEVVGTTDSAATFAFCSSPESLYSELYKGKFDTFLNSIKLK